MNRSSKGGIFSQAAIDAANRVPREEIRAIKHMSKPELVHYFQSVYQKGYEKGREAGLEEAKAAFNSASVSEHTPEKGKGADGTV